MQVHITISSQDGATSTSITPSPGAGGDSGALHVTAAPGAAATGPGGDAINAGAAPPTLAFATASASGSGGHQGASDQSAGPAPQF